MPRSVMCAISLVMPVPWGWRSGWRCSRALTGLDWCCGSTSRSTEGSTLAEDIGDVRPRIPVEGLGSDAGFRGGVLRLQPDLCEAFLDFYGDVWSRGVLDHPAKEMVRIRNARLVDCAY